MPVISTDLATPSDASPSNPPGPTTGAAGEGCEVQAFRKRLPVHGFWVVSGRGLGFIAVIAANAVLARCLTREEFADFSVAVSFVAFTSGLAASGMELMIVRRVSECLAVKALAEAARQLKGVLRLTKILTLLTALGRFFSCSP